MSLFTHGGDGPVHNNTVSTSTTPQRHKAHLITRSSESFAVSSPTQQQLQQLQNSLLENAKINFKLWDKNNDHKIDINDVKNVLQKSDFNDDDIQTILNTITSTNTNNSSIDYDTFIQATMKKFNLTQNHTTAPFDQINEMQEALRAAKRDYKQYDNNNQFKFDAKP